MSLASFFPHPPRPNHSTSVMAFGRKQKRGEEKGEERRERTERGGRRKCRPGQDTQLQDMDGSGRRVERMRREWLQRPPLLPAATKGLSGNLADELRGEETRQQWPPARGGERKRRSASSSSVSPRQDGGEQRRQPFSSTLHVIKKKKEKEEEGESRVEREGELLLPVMDVCHSRT